MKFGTLFAGGGLACQGLKKAGHELQWAIELNPQIAQVYETNFGIAPIVASVADTNPHDLDPIDLLWLSPPCQQWSQARPSNLPRHVGADIGFAVLKYFEVLRPRVVVLENVEGYRHLEQIDPETQKLIQTPFGAIVQCLRELGYWLTWDVLTCSDYGIPQTRRRLILRAVRCGWVPALPPQSAHGGWYAAMADIIDGFDETTLAKWQIEALPDRIQDSVLVAAGQVGANGKRWKNPQESAWTVCAAGVNKAILVPRDGARKNDQGKLSFKVANKPAPTVRALGHDSHCWLFDALTETKIVRVSPRGLARLQTLDDSYQLPDNPVLATKIIGNGVPSHLAFQLGRDFV